jgi:DNA-binding Xre family transcriptional regulator
MPKAKKSERASRPLGEVVSRIGLVMSASGHTGNEIARRTGLSRQTIRKLRTGDFDSIHLDTLALLCREFDAEVSDLIQYENP